jgi:hypothetical protein
MQTVIGKKIDFTLGQRLDVVRRIEQIIKDAGLSSQLQQIDWNSDMDFPVVEPLSVIEALPPALKMKYLILINRIIEVSVA